MARKAINFARWIDDHREDLKPPVCNKKVFEEDDFIVMVVGGPNSRKDYHIDEGPELFYQLEGEMVLKTIQEGRVVDIPIRAGEMYLHPPRVPHSPQRSAGSVGLVVERKRLPHEKDGLQWYCDRCTTLLYEEYFSLHDVEKDFPPVFDRFFASADHRTCRKCGAVMPAPSR
jgi:3-hydroxyanthranilate 3,4-dioxygenase